MSQTSPPFPDAALRGVLTRFAGARAEAAARAARAIAEAARAPSDDADPSADVDGAVDGSVDGSEENVRTREMETGEAPRFAFVDGFAGAEFAFGTGVARGADEETRAAAVIAALGGISDVTVNVALVEEDPAYLQRIYADLERTDASERVRGTRDFSILEPGEIALAEVPFHDAAQAVAAFVGSASHPLVWLAPPAARQLPWALVKTVIAASRGDVLVRFPATDFEKQARFPVPMADLPPFARRIVEGCSAMLDDAKHAWLPEWRAAERSGGLSAALDAAAARYEKLLSSVAGDRIVRAIRLADSEDGRTETRLFLVSADPLAALDLNTAIRDAGLIDRAATRLEASAEPEEAPPESPLLDLFPADVAPPPAPSGPRTDAAALAERIARGYVGRTLPWRELTRAFAHTDATPDDLRRALALLKRDGRAVFRALEDGELVDFPTEPVKPAPRAASKSGKKKRKAAPGEVGLFGDLDEDEG